MLLVEKMTLDEVCEDYEKNGCESVYVVASATKFIFNCAIIIQNEEGLRSMDDLYKWHNPKRKIRYPDKTKPPRYISQNGKPVYWTKKKYPNAVNGDDLADSLQNIADTYYNCAFIFCKPEEVGAEIAKLLTGGDS